MSNRRRIFKNISPNDFQETGLFHYTDLDDGLADVACADERGVGHIGLEYGLGAGGSGQDSR